VPPLFVLPFRLSPFFSFFQYVFFRTTLTPPQTFSLITANVTWLLIISYHKIADVESGHLRAPPLFPEFASLDIAPALLERGNFR
jgi:hypothetical protein